MAADAGAAVRLFVALWPDAAVRRHLVEWRNAWSCRGDARPAWVAEERLHLTLHFLGSVAVERAEPIAHALDLQAEPFALEFGRAASWPHGLTVLEPDGAIEPLVRLHARLGAALEAVSVETEDRPYRPHVTLARRAHGARPAAPGPRFTWPVAGHALVRSKGGAGYDVLVDYPWKPAVSRVATGRSSPP